MLKKVENRDIIYLNIRWDYMNNKTLISTAMLSAYWEKEKKDTLDLIDPFIKYSIAKTTTVGNAIDIPQLSAYFKSSIKLATSTLVFKNNVILFRTCVGIYLI